MTNHKTGDPLAAALAEIRALDDTGSSPACILPALLHVVANALLYEEDDCAEDAAAVILYASELAAKLEPGLKAARAAIGQAQTDAGHGLGAAARH